MERELFSARAKQSNRKVDTERVDLLILNISFYQTKRTPMKTKGVGTESNNFEIMKVKECELKIWNLFSYCFCLALGR